MTEIEIVNACGLACPQPVVLAKKALESHKQVRVIVDNDTALENVTRLGAKLGCDVASEKKNAGTYEINLTRKTDNSAPKEEFVPPRGSADGSVGPFVIVISADKMGRGNDELGYVLIRAFLHTVAGQTEKPDVMIFYNSGVKLTLMDSEVLDDLKELAVAGVEMLVCGTCLNYFEAEDQLGVGIISNMYDITGTMSKAGRLVYP
jgi:selenium metabolism protein YedF